MSDHQHVPEVEKLDPARTGGWPNLLLGAGAVGIGVSLIGGIFWHEQFAYSWLFGFAYFFTICMGALFWTCVHHATDSEWSVVVRRQLENVAGLLPYLFVFFIPILFCLGILYKWWDLPPGADPLLDKKQFYLSHWFFYFRLGFYVFLMTWISTYLRRLSTRQDEDGAARHSILMRRFGIGGIPAVAICITFGGIDWLMGLNYHWYSTMWGVYLFAGAAGSSMSLLVLIITALKANGYLKVVNEEHYHMMGKWMLAFTIFWAYIGFDQYMLIWYANIPEENIYYIIRNTGNWQWLSFGLVLFRFFLPFPILLTQWVKKAPQYLKYMAMWVLLMQLMDMFVIVLPALHKSGFGFMDVIFSVFPLVGIGGVLGWLFLRNLSASYLFPTKDPRLAGSLKMFN